VAEQSQVEDDPIGLAVEVAIRAESSEEEVGEATEEEEERFEVEGDHRRRRLEFSGIGHCEGEVLVVGEP
jgi:hypothetical protein